MTVLDVLQSATAYFKKRGIENPRLNAEHLLAHSLGQKRLDVYLEFERDLAEPELAPLRELVRRRGKTSRSNICSARSNFAETSFSATNARSFRDRKRKNLSGWLNRKS